MHYWANCTGQGVSEKHPAGFEAEVYTKCIFCYTIQKIIQDRSSLKDLACTEELYNHIYNVSSDEKTIEINHVKRRK